MSRPLLVLTILLLGGASADAGPQHDESRKTLLAALHSPRPETRLRAFDVLDGHADLLAVRVGVEGVAEALRDRARILRQVAEDVRVHENARADLYEAERRVAGARKRRVSAGRLRLLERAKTRAAEYLVIKGAALGVTRADLRTSRALLASVARPMAALLRRLDALGRRTALLILRTAWADSDEQETWLLWSDTLVATNRTDAAEELERAVGETFSPGRLRALALDALVGLGEKRASRVALPYLLADLESHWHLVAAAIATLRAARRKEAIGGLIAFLARPGIGRLREDAHAALVGLTHRRHGPYAGPWERWWRSAGPAFVVPPSPPPRDAGAQGSATAFYGIQTFSDRMAFVLDVSGSMWAQADAAAADAPRPIDVALRELRGTVGTLDAERRFAVVWFGSDAGTWMREPVPATEAEKRRLARWTRDLAERGQTNAHDGLDRAFDLARRGAGRPLVDTVFFLTDGAANAGPLTATPDLLAEVRAWCRLERIRLHAVGVGAHEPTLLQGLARTGGGRYVQKMP